jgi:hypothetical protein
LRVSLRTIGALILVGAVVGQPVKSALERLARAPHTHVSKKLVVRFATHGKFTRLVSMLFYEQSRLQGDYDRSHETGLALLPPFQTLRQRPPQAPLFLTPVESLSQLRC